MTSRPIPSVLVLLAAAVLTACGGNKPPVANAPPPPGPTAFPGASTAANTTPRPPDPPPVPPDPSVTSTPIGSLNDRSIDDLNGPNSPFKPVYFTYDDDSLDDEAKKVLAANAEVLKTNRNWVITIEGHCDERGSAEYNLSLGDRRALTVRNYLMSLGIAADRLRTVSYGKEFPFDPGHTESAYRLNRRAHFMLTAK